MKMRLRNETVEVEDQLPEKGQLALFDNKIWKVTELHGTEIIHLQRPRHREAVSLYGRDLRCVKRVMLRREVTHPVS